MLAVVSMALVSCGGGGLKPAKNAFLYADHGDCLGRTTSEIKTKNVWDDKLDRYVDIPDEKYYFVDIDEKGSNDCLKDYLKITRAAISKTGMRQLAVTVDLEVVKDIVLPKSDLPKCEECYDYYEVEFKPYGRFELLDKNLVLLADSYERRLPEGKKGDVKSLSIDIETGNYNGKDSPDAILKNAKYVRFNNVSLRATSGLGSRITGSRYLYGKEKIN